MPIAVGISKLIAIKQETTNGIIAGPTAAQYLRRVTSSIDLTKASYASNEILTSHQVRDFRHGVRTVSGSLNGELSPGAYPLLIGSTLRRDFANGATTGALTNITAAAGPPGTFTRATGSFLTDGFKVNDVVRWTGWVTGGSTANNARNYRITALTATVMTVGTATTGAVGQPEAVVAQVAGDSVTCTVFGKKTFVPQTGHTNTAFTIEHWFPDVPSSEVFVGCKPGSLGLNLPPTGLSTINVGVTGMNMVTNASQYFTTPTAMSAGAILASANGVLRVQGVDIAIVTGLSINVSANLSTEAVVGSNFTPDVFRGKVMVTGQFTALFDSATLRDFFVNETEISIAFLATGSNAINADFINIVLPRIKVGSAGKSDGERALVGTYSFQALENTAGGAGVNSEATTISIQDSLA